MSDIINWNSNLFTEVMSEMVMLTAAVLLGIHIEKWGVISNNIYLSLIIIFVFVAISVGLRSTIRR